MERYESLKNKPGKNFIYPFFWPDEHHPEQIPEEMEAVYRSGCGGVCLEARPFEDFGGETWWHTAKTVLEEAKKRGMKVWILDDKHFPTGYANGCIEHKYPELRRRWLKEHHLDVYGPRNNITVRLPDCDEYEKIIYACMIKRLGEDETLTDECAEIRLTEGAEFAELSVPAGMWRIFFIIETSDPHRGGGWHIDMLSGESSRVLIEAVYEEHYSHLKEYFGETLEGFFSDEPSLCTSHDGPWHKDANFYYRTVGQPGNALPWNKNVIEKMKDSGISSVLSEAPYLWYDGGGKESAIRLAYMNAVTMLWNENFSFALGNWCRAHGLIYTGHIIEDNNAHSRISASGGHYFRNLGGQDISGIDIVLHQVLPGCSDYKTSASISEGYADGRFFHYTLAHLASSLARITPHMRGRAMCELFGAYGWAEDMPMMKWLTDFLLIRGVNRFVPHAFSVKHPFDDCPPHFYAKGDNPQFEGFSALMPYINRVSGLLENTVRRTDGAILYYAENEWASVNGFMTGDAAAKALYDEHIDYDIVPLDSLETASVAGGKLYINGIPHNFLVIPGAEIYAPKTAQLAEKLIKLGLPVFTLTNGSFGGFGTLCTEKELVPFVRQRKLAADYGIPASKLRIAEYDGENEKIFFMFNEEPADKTDTDVRLPAKGGYSEINLLNDGFYGGETADGRVRVRLAPGESVLFAFNGKHSAFPPKKEYGKKTVLDIKWDIALRENGRETEFKEYRKNSAPVNITALSERPGFSGEIRYTGKFGCTSDSAVIDLGEVGSTARIKVNGKAFPIRITAPYAWDISGAVKKGENDIEIVAANTLCNRIPDGFSAYLPLRASGVQGPVTLLTDDTE